MSTTLHDAIVYGAAATSANLNAPLGQLDAAIIAHTYRDVADHGAVCDGVTDDTAAIQAAIDASATDKLPILLSGVCLITDTLTIESSETVLFGRGSGHYHSVGSGAGEVSALVWGGAAGGTMLYVAPVEGASNRRLNGVIVDNIGLFGEGVAAIGLDVRSAMFCRFRVYVESCTTTGVNVNVVTTLGEWRDTQDCDFWIEGAQEAVTAPILTIGGDATANTCYCDFRKVWGQHADAAYGVDVGNSDSNIFWDVRLGPVATANLILRGSNSAQSQSARSNVFVRLNGQAVSEGTDAKTYQASKNTILRYAQENGEPDPSIGTDSSLWWHSDAYDFDVWKNKSQPAQITSNKNDWAVGAGSTSSAILYSDAARDITGITGGVDGKLYLLINVGAYTLTLKHESGSSSAANRFVAPGSADHAIRAGGSALLFYTSSRWRVVAP